MGLVTSKKMLLNAQKNGYAIGAFNVENMEFVQAVIEAAEELYSPVIVQTTPGTLKYANEELIYANVRTIAERAKVPVVLHLDHGNSFELAVKCLCAGYTSIMIDGSHKSYEENISIVKSVTDVCHAADIPVEAELGMVGGKEDDLVDNGNSPYTDPIQAKDYVEKTGIDSLAIAIGTMHGIYKVMPKLDVNRITAVKSFVDIPLVLHGTSGVPDDIVRECVRRGMCKVNYATDLRVAFSEGIKGYLRENQDVIDPKKYCAIGKEKIKACVKSKIRVVGSAGMADKF